MAEYIEREALKEHLMSYAGMFTSELGFVVNLQAVLAGIDFQPAADVAPVVHGRWINWGKSGTPTYENYGTCSVCHEDAEICTEHRNYCPNCGAKMDGGKNDAD